MGYTYRNNGKIQDFWPDDTEDEFYLCSAYTMVDILREINLHWGEVNMGQIEISSENIHTTCLTYDSYDSSDYTDFLVIRRIK